MTIQRNNKECGHKRRGFSLLELTIVLGIMGIIVGALWGYMSSTTQSARIQQSVEDISLITDSTRNAYGGQAAITGGVLKVMPYLIGMGAFPTHLLKNATTANTPWGGVLQVCSWVVGTNTKCLLPISATTSQYFAVEFTQLTYQSCLVLATRATPTSPIVGLGDVYINGNSASAASGIPVKPAFAAAPGQCNKVSPPANIVDFIYALRTPLS